MIPRVKIISRKAVVVTISGTGGSARMGAISHSGFRGQSSLRKFLGSKEHLDWLKIRTVKDYMHQKLV